VSPWWRERVHASVGPLRVELVRARGAASARASARTLVPEGDLQDWHPALAELEAMLAGMSGMRGGELRVQLSNQFVRYAVLPWSDALRSEGEVLAYARHRLRETYGDLAQDWTIALAAGWPGRPRVVAAIEPALVTALGAAARRAGLRLAAVEPHFTALADRCRRRMRAKQFWLAASESGRVVLARASRGEWVSLATARAGGDPARALMAMLAREGLVAPAEPAPKQLYTAGMAPAHAAALADAGWQVVPLDDAAVKPPELRP